MSAAARKAVSERMKKYWAERRRQMAGEVAAVAPFRAGLEPANPPVSSRSRVVAACCYERLLGQKINDLREIGSIEIDAE
jgi:hypothetical protein